MSTRLEKALLASTAWLSTLKANRDFQGITVVVDRPAGFVQRGQAPDGTAWERTYTHDYGYLPGTQGGDGEGLDVFLGPHAASPDAFWITQSRADGSFDEYKLMLGFAGEAEAKAVYLAHVPEQFFAGIATMPLEMAKALLGIEPKGVMKALLPLALAVCRLGGSASPPTVGAKEQRARLVQTTKADELRYVLGIVLEPDVVDLQGDTYDATTIRDSAWSYLANFRNVSLQHRMFLNGRVEVVESFLAPADMGIGDVAIKEGTWLMGLRLLDEDIWQAVKTGKLTGLSIGGFAVSTAA